MPSFLRVPGRVRRAPERCRRVSRALVREPAEMVYYAPEVLARQFDRIVPYQVDEEWGPTFHQMLGLPWPCPESEGLNTVWADIGDRLESHGLSFGRYTYGEYSDSDAGLAGAAWCAVRHLHATTVVETGVARGVTSQVILEALSRNGAGHLWSVDLPHPFAPELHGEIAAAVPGRRHDRWSYIRGSSRRRLPVLLSQLGEIDLFVHDSLHTARNMSFEMNQAWPRLPVGGVMLVDDVNNQSFRDFVAHAQPTTSAVCRSADGTWMFGIARKGIDLSSSPRPQSSDVIYEGPSSAN
jgi:Methyltransferase domain